MSGNVSLSRKQAKLLQALTLGESIVGAAKQAGITEQTAHRWLKLSHVQAERERLETEVRVLEEQEIKRILTSGYALMHKRIEALNKLAYKLQGYMDDEDNIWLPDVKAIGNGPLAERVDLIRFNDALISEYRATFADLAAEVGHRIKKKEVALAILPKEYHGIAEDEEGSVP